jgi:rare lipoprotein A
LKLNTSARPLTAGAVSVAALAAGAPAAPAQAPATAAVFAAKPRITVAQSKLDVRLGRHVVVGGRLAPATSGVRVALQMWTGDRWATIDRDRTRPSGRYALRDRRRSTGSRALRVRNAAAPGVLAAKRRVGRLNVFRVANASWYGPGLYGNPLGCGGRLIPGRLGVAHKTLPCGTKVTLKHGRRSVRVPVIDRGPYVGGREYDLTQATAQRLGWVGVGGILVTR